jgi:sugar-specific transcriptional regulator TrmB
LKSEERLVTLTELGLTNNQAKIYLALLQAGPATANELAKNSKISRPDIYRIIPFLQKKGLVEKLMTKPSSFQAIPATYVLPTLLKNKTTEQSQLKKKTEDLLSDLKNNHAKKETQRVKTEFILIPGKKVVVQRLKEAIETAQTSVSAVTSKKRFSAAILEFAKTYETVLKRGVKIRIVTEYHVADTAASRIVQTLSRDPNFEVKYFAAPPSAIVAIFDNKEVCITMHPTAQLAEASAIWSNNRSFVALAQNYFEKKWNGNFEVATATTPKQVKH